MAYKDMILRVSQKDPNHFVATALEEGQLVASNSFDLRLDELRILERLWDLEKEAVRPDSKETFHFDFGQELYKKVLAGDLGNYFQKQIETDTEGLRISLQFDDSASKLEFLPWEFLHNGDDFLVAGQRTLITRLPTKRSKVRSQPLESILRMLVIISSPNDPSCAPLNTENERDRILQAVDNLYVQHKMEVDFTDDATFETIQSYLNEKDYHIVHFTGHGKEIADQGYLILETKDNQARVADSRIISDLFAGHGIRLAVLNACESAMIARELVSEGVPGAVAMQYSILDPSATTFAFAFYQALANGRAVDHSLTEARLAMRNAEGGNKIDFATPILYLLDPNCLHIESIKPAPFEQPLKPVMLGDLQVMKDGFVGRQRELRILQKTLLSGSKRAAIIHGWGGIGKTILATRLAMRMTDHFEGVYGYKCNLKTRPEDILNGLNSFLNLAGISALNQVINQSVSMQVKIAVLVSILNQKRFLIILDNFESCLDESKTQIADKDLRQFVEQLLNATASNTKYIITTRNDFDPLHGRLLGAIEHLSVPEMPFYQALWLMNNHSELAGLDPDKKKKIYRTIGGHPWTIGMFAKHAKASVDGLLLELEPLEKELKDFALFDKSFSELDKSSKNLLLRASIFEEAVPVEALRWMVGDEKNPSPSVDQPLDMLMRWGLIASLVEGSETLYSTHTLVRQFAAREAEQIGIKRHDLQVRAAQYYELRVKESKNLWDHLRARDYYYQAKEWEKAADIVIAAHGYLAHYGYVEQAMNLLQQSADTTSGATKTIATGDLAILYHEVGDWKTALKSLTEVKEMLEMEGDKENVAVTLHQLGMIHYGLGNYSEAVKLYQQSLDIKRELGDKLGIAYTLHQLGNIHYSQGNYSEAVKLYQQSLDIKRELGDKLGIANTLHQLGNIHYSQGNYSEAVKLYQQSLDLAKNLVDKSAIASILHSLGNVHSKQGNYPEAAKLFQQSLDLAKKLGDKSLIANATGQLGNIHLAQGNYSEAVKLFQQSLDLAKELGDISVIALSLYGLGNVHLEQGNYPEAAKLYQQSLDLAKKLGNKSVIALSIYSLGMIKEENKDFEGAIENYVKAFSIFEEIQDPSRENAMMDITRLREIIGEDAFRAVLDRLRLGGSQ